MSETLQIDLDVVLPHAHGAEDRCVSDLVNSLQRLDGVDSAHVISDGPVGDDSAASSSATLCLHLAPGAVSIRRLMDRIRATGVSIDGRYGHLVGRVDDVGNTSRSTALTERLRSTNGVVDAAVTVEGVVRVEYDKAVIDDGSLEATLRRLGLRTRTVPAEEDHRHDDHQDGHGPGDGHGHAHGASRAELGAAAVSLIIYLVARTLDWFSDLDGPVMVLYVIAALVTGVFVARDAWLSVRARVFDIDS